MVIATAGGASTEEQGKQKPVESPRVDAETSQGCFKSVGTLKEGSELGVKYKGTEVSSGMCKDLAKKQKAPVFAMKGEKCYLGEEYPPEDDLVDDEKCNFNCPAYPQEACKYRLHACMPYITASLTIYDRWWTRLILLSFQHWSRTGCSICRPVSLRNYFTWSG